MTVLDHQARDTTLHALNNGSWKPKAFHVSRHSSDEDFGTSDAGEVVRVDRSPRYNILPTFGERLPRSHNSSQTSHVLKFYSSDEDYMDEVPF